MARVTTELHPAAGEPARTPAWGLGLDGGGTQTRWALADATGQVRAEGHVGGVSGLMLADDAGRATLQQTLAALALDVSRSGQASGHAGRPVRLVAGLTGFASADADALQQLLAAPFGLPAAAVRLMSDIELACQAAFAPGQGAVVYAGTGSIAAHIDSRGELHRAGGRGAVIDDAGGGHWIARQALCRVWRAEDAEPGAGHRSALGRQLFAAVGGSDWAATRAKVYGASRGEVGTLALAVAAAAHEGDVEALALLRQAGLELARLAHCLHQRFGALPLALAGRVFDLHPVIEASLRAALPGDTHAQRLQQPAHHLAAVLAAMPPAFQGRP